MQNLYGASRQTPAFNLVFLFARSDQANGGLLCLLAAGRLCGELLGLGGHDEVVAMHALNRMSPPRHGDLSPDGKQCRMMRLGLGESADGVVEGEGMFEVAEQK